MARASKAPKRRPLKIRSGDEVLVMSGKDRGKRGRVLRVESAKERVYVEGLNMIKRYTPPPKFIDGGEDRTLSGVIDREGPIHISNVLLLDPKDEKPSRVGIEREDGKGYRVTPRPVFDALAGKRRQLAYKAGDRGRCQRIHDHREGRRRRARRPHTRQPGERR